MVRPGDGHPENDQRPSECQAPFGCRKRLGLRRRDEDMGAVMNNERHHASSCRIPRSRHIRGVCVVQIDLPPQQDRPDQASDAANCLPEDLHRPGLDDDLPFSSERQARRRAYHGIAPLRAGACAFVCCNGLLASLHSHGPVKPIFEVLEARRADPMILVLCAVPLMKAFGILPNRELCPTEEAMVVVPLWVLRTSAILTTNKSNAGDKVLLPPQSPVVVCRRHP